MNLQFNWRIAKKKRFIVLSGHSVFMFCGTSSIQPCGKKQFQLSSKGRLIEQTSENSWGDWEVHFIRFNVPRLQAMMKNENSQQNYGAVFSFVFSWWGQKGPRIFALKKEEKLFMWSKIAFCFQLRCYKVENIWMNFQNLFMLICGWKLMWMFGRWEVMGVNRKYFRV